MGPPVHQRKKIVFLENGPFFLHSQPALLLILSSVLECLHKALADIAQPRGEAYTCIIMLDSRGRGDRSMMMTEMGI